MLVCVCACVQDGIGGGGFNQRFKQISTITRIEQIKADQIDQGRSDRSDQIRLDPYLFHCLDIWGQMLSDQIPIYLIIQIFGGRCIPDFFFSSDPAFNTSHRMVPIFIIQSQIFRGGCMPELKHRTCQTDQIGSDQLPIYFMIQIMIQISGVPIFIIQPEIFRGGYMPELTHRTCQTDHIRYDQISSPSISLSRS